MPSDLAAYHSPGGVDAALVVGLTAGGLALGRALAGLGVPAVGLYESERECGRHSRSFRAVAPRPASPTDALRLAGKGARKAVFLPTSDAAILWLAREVDSLPAGTIAYVPPPAVLEGWFDKANFPSDDVLLTRILNPPGTVHLDASGPVSDSPGPWIAKPRSAVVEARRIIGKTHMLWTRAELDAFARKHAAHAGDIVLQEWIPGPDHCHGFCGGYVARDGTVHVVQAGHKVLQSPPGNGVSCIARRKELPDLVARSREFLGAISLRGFFEVEWKWDDRIRAWRFLELNLRPWMTLAMSPGEGQVLMSLALADQGVAPSCRSRECLEDPDEWRDDLTLLSLHLRGWRPQPARAGRQVVHAVWKASDPLPFLADCIDTVANRIRKSSRLLMRRLRRNAR